MEDKKYLVYQIYNKEENKSYIGSTCNFNIRIKTHKRGKKEWQIDFATHPEKWKVNVLEDNIDEKNVSEKELYYIDLYDAIDNGYNINRIGNIQTAETRLKISKAESGKFVSEETRKKLSDANKNKSIPEETIRKRIETFKSNYKKENHPNYGKHPSEETLEKMRKPKTEEHKRKISETLHNLRWVVNSNNEAIRISVSDLDKYISLGYKRGCKYK